MQGVILKRDKEKPILQRHPWIFSGAIESYPENYSIGDIVPIFSSQKVLLGYGYFNPEHSLAGRVISFGQENPLSCFDKNMEKAIRFRFQQFDLNQTNAFRLINAEGDLIPGLTIDYYNGYLVVQISTLGIEKLKDRILGNLKTMVPHIKGIYEKSLSISREEEGLALVEKSLLGDCKEEVQILENNIPFLVSYQKGQKTGFFLDQRNMRSLVGAMAKNKRVLNCFCYTGGFSIYALKNNAQSVTSIDASEEAIEMAKRNAKINQIDPSKHECLVEDVFKYLRNHSLDFDFVILDPPAFAKKRKDVDDACRGYKEINLQALKKMPADSYLLTCSCSSVIDEKLFQTVIFQAALEARRNVKIISKHHLAFDHPINLYHPEGNYLKSLLLYVE
jgi:23S rRNA (cytosine1962-C5)-methyltransferase